MKGNGQNINELTRIEAFLLSEKAGHPSHMHDYFWTQAEAIVRQRAAIVDIAVKAAGKKVTKAGKPTKAKLTAAKAKKPVEPTPAARTPKKPAVMKKAAPTGKKTATKSK